MYTLNFDIKFSKDRVKYVEKILDESESIPTSTDLEKLADYILYGQDEKYLNAVDEKQIISPTYRKNNWKSRKESKQDSIEERSEVGAEQGMHQLGKVTKYKKASPKISRPIYDEKNRIIDYGDSDIPGMQQLWDTIDSLQERYDMYRGKATPNEWILSNPINSYQLYLMSHMLVELRQQQYFLKAAYRPTLKYLQTQEVTKVEINFDQDTGYWLPRNEWIAKQYIEKTQPPLEEVPRRGNQLYWSVSKNTINLENPDHVSAVLDHYAAILVENYENFNSPGRVLCRDIELLIDRANLTEEEYFLLIAKVAHTATRKIYEYFPQKTPLQVNNTMSRMLKKMANTAARYRLLYDDSVEKVKCLKCGRYLPQHHLFFYRNNSRKSGFCSQCRECQGGDQNS